MNCYVMNPLNGAPIPEGINKSNTLFYPEAGMTTQQQFETARPRDFHIVTDSPFLVPLYDRLEVFIWEDGEWKHPDVQTYGAGYSRILTSVFGGPNIPRAVYDGKVTNCMGSKL
jgi:hypothetical protein